MGLKEMVISFVLVGLFFVAMVNFGANLAIDNNANQSILEDPRINSTFQDTNVQLFAAYDTANESRVTFERDEIKADSDNLIITSIKGVGTAVGGTLSAMANLMFGTLGDVLNVPPVALATIMAILGISIVFASWRAYRAGS